MDSKYWHALLWMKVESNRPRQCHSPELFSHITYKDTWNIAKNKYCCTCERVEHKHRQQTVRKIQSMIQHHWHGESHTSIYPSISRYIYYLFLTMLNMYSSWSKQLPSSIGGPVVLTQGEPLTFVSLHISPSRCKATSRTSPESLGLKRRTVDAFDQSNEFNPSTLARRLKRTFD